MNPRPLPLLLAPLWLLIALILLVSCTAQASTPPATAAVGNSGVGVATASVMTVVPAGTSVIGIEPDVTLPPAPTLEPPTPIPTLPSSALSPTQLKYTVLDRYPDFFFCDPDLYPIARADEGQLALQRFASLEANTEDFQAILAH